MEPSLPPPVNPQADPATPPNQTATDKMSQATGEFIHNNYETWLRKIFGFIFTLLKMIQSAIMQVISQILSK